MQVAGIFRKSMDVVNPPYLPAGAGHVLCKRSVCCHIGSASSVEPRPRKHAVARSAGSCALASFASDGSLTQIPCCARSSRLQAKQIPALYVDAFRDRGAYELGYSRVYFYAPGVFPRLSNPHGQSRTWVTMSSRQQAGVAMVQA